MKQANFRNDLVRGQQGEAMFHLLFPDLQRLDGRNADFKAANGETYEIKTDSYTSGNYFMEVYSDVAREKRGGPWQSQEKGIDYYVYMFPKLGKLYIFSVPDLVQQLEALPDAAKRVVNVENRSWTTQGWLVKIEHLTPTVEMPLATTADLI